MLTTFSRVLWAASASSVRRFARSAGIPPFSTASIAVLGSAVMAGCATAPMPTNEQQALQSWGQPTSRYSLPGGLQRLEYASGPMGHTTWMLDVNSQGQVTQARQVLTENELRAVQAQMPLPAVNLVQQIGRPGQKRPGGWAGGQVWSWRYTTYDCLWFQVSVGDDGVATSGAFLPDPVCDVNDGDYL